MHSTLRIQFAGKSLSALKSFNLPVACPEIYAAKIALSTITWKTTLRREGWVVNPSAQRPSNDVATQSLPSANSGEQSTKAKQHKQRLRLDDFCVQQYPQYSKNVVQSWILQGKVLVDDRVVSKAGHQVTTSSKVVINAVEPKYVCRGGLKLEKALQHFSIDATGKVCLDSGQSTGGFTDCLLQHGASKVFGIDVGYGQVADRVRRDGRVVVIERFNVRHLKPSDLPCQIDLATLDLSFISVLKVVPAVVGVMREDAALLVLIKPQFEAGREQVGYGGLVKDPQVHQQVIQKVTQGIQALGFRLHGVTESPIKGDKSGNTEFLAYFTRDPGQVQATAAAVQAAVAAAAEDGENDVSVTGAEPPAAVDTQEAGGVAGDGPGSWGPTDSNQLGSRRNRSQGSGTQKGKRRRH